MNSNLTLILILILVPKYILTAQNILLLSEGSPQGQCPPEHTLTHTWCICRQNTGRGHVQFLLIAPFENMLSRADSVGDDRTLQYIYILLKSHPSMSPWLPDGTMTAQNSFVQIKVLFTHLVTFISCRAWEASLPFYSLQEVDAECVCVCVCFCTNHEKVQKLKVDEELQSASHSTWLEIALAGFTMDTTRYPWKQLSCRWHRSVQSNVRVGNQLLGII